MNGIGHKRSAAVAKLPVPALGGGQVYGGGKLRGVAVATGYRRKINRWRRAYGNLVRSRIAATSGDGNNQGNRVGSCCIVDMGRILQPGVIGRSRGRIAEIPVPSADSSLWYC